MSAQAMVFFLTGMFLEVIWLWMDAHLTPRPQKNPLLGLLVQPRWLAAIGLIGLAGAITAILDALGVSQRVYIDTIWVMLPTVALGVYIAFAGMVTGELLPRVNEQSVLAVQLILIVHQAFEGNLFEPLTLVLVVLPAAVVFYLTIRQSSTPPTVKALVYFWYLLSLLVLGFQSEQMAFFSAKEFTLFEGLVFGMLLVFLIVHGLFAIRFFLMISSLILPRNRAYLPQVMPVIYYDEQAPTAVFMVMTGLLLGTLAALRLFEIENSLLWLDIAVILSVQVFFHAAAQPGKPSTKTLQ